MVILQCQKNSIALLNALFNACGHSAMWSIKQYRQLKGWSAHQQLKWTDYPLVEVEDRVSSSSSSERWAIPGNVYQIWLNNRFGKRHAEAISRFRDLNPGLNFRLFSHEKADAYINSHWRQHPICEIYNSALFGPLKADLFRYCILWDEGGYYFDIDCSVDVPLRCLHTPTDRRLLTYETSYASCFPRHENLHCFQHPERNLAMWGFGFAKRDPILQRVIDNICSHADYCKGRIFENPKSAILAFSGPGMLTRSIREFVHSEGVLEGVQAGIDFNGHGCTWMPGSEVRFHQVKSYVTAKNRAILSAA